MSTKNNIKYNYGGLAMDGKTRKMILISAAILFLIVITSMFFILINSKELEFGSGKYYCKINISSESTFKGCKWDIGISKINFKNDIIESESNRQTLEKFRETVSKIPVKRFTLFLSALYLIFLLVTLIIVQKDSQLLKKDSNRKYFYLIISPIIIFVIYIILTNFLS